jgi:uncharacterized protein
MDLASTFFVALFNALAQGAPYIVLGYLFAALIKEFVPVRVMVQQFGHKGVLPLFKAVTAGAILPICSCGVIPLGIGAFKCGTARGTTLAFMTAAPTVSPVMVLLSLSLLGPSLTMVFVAVALSGALLIGLAGNWLLGGESERAFRASQGELSEDEQIPASTRGNFAAKIKGAVKWAFWDLGSDVSFDLLIGLSIAAAVITLLPMEWIATWLGKQHIATLFYVILIGIPVYTCSVPSVPVVRSLLLFGMSPGAAVAYLFAGPATNLGELKALSRQMGKKTAFLFAGGLFTMALLGGLVTDHLIFRNYQYQATSAHGQVLVAECCVPLIFNEQSRVHAVRAGLQLVPAWHWPFVVLLGITLLLGIGRRIAGLLKRDAAKVPEPATLAAGE